VRIELPIGEDALEKALSVLILSTIWLSLTLYKSQATH